MPTTPLSVGRLAKIIEFLIDNAVGKLIVIQCEPGEDFRVIKSDDVETLVFDTTYYIKNSILDDRTGAITTITGLLKTAGIEAVCTPLEGNEVTFTVVVTSIPEGFTVPEDEIELKDYNPEDYIDDEDEDSKGDNGPEDGAYGSDFDG